MQKFARLSCILALSSLALAASAAPFKYTLSGLGMGTLNGSDFGKSVSGPVQVTLTGFGDTSTFNPAEKNPNDFTPSPILFQTVKLGNISISVDGLAGDALNESMRLQKRPNSEFVYFTDDFVLVAGITNSALASYGLVSETNVSSTAAGSGSGSASNGLPTLSGGRFALTSLSNPSFSAVAVQPSPEPATMAALGLGALAMLRRRKRAQCHRG